MEDQKLKRDIKIHNITFQLTLKYCKSWVELSWQKHFSLLILISTWAITFHSNRDWNHLWGLRNTYQSRLPSDTKHQTEKLTFKNQHLQQTFLFDNHSWFYPYQNIFFNYGISHRVVELLWLPYTARLIISMNELLLTTNRNLTRAGSYIALMLKSVHRGWFQVRQKTDLWLSLFSVYLQGWDDRNRT